MSGQGAEMPAQAMETIPRPDQTRRLKWWIVAALAVAEFGFDLVIEPWLRTGTSVEEVVERYMVFAEVAVIGVLVWVTFDQLERLQRRLEERRRELATLYEQAQRGRRQLEALHEASVAIAREEAYPQVLSRIVALAAELAQARYGALAEIGEDGRVVEFVTYGMSPEQAQRVGSPPAHRGLLRRLMGNEPVRLGDVPSEPDFTGFPAGHPDVRTFLGVPVRWQGQLLGHLYLGEHGDGAPFTADEERLLEMFALEAAVAIHRGRLERSAAERAREAERRRIAMELHDSALQSLYAVGIQLDRARRRGLHQLSDAMSLDLAMDAIERAMTTIRGLLDADAGRPPALDLHATVRATARMYGVQLRWRGGAVALGLTPACAVELGACLSEAVANAARHGKATQVWVAWRRTNGGEVGVRVTDNGTGPPRQGLCEGHGIRHVRQRIESLGGSFAIEAGARGGLVWRLRLPHGVCAALGQVATLQAPPA
ncbi:MAG: GAF domain-containing protein [Firmicutes bacterium]|nr:GAF domain-containing protein [Bacillota bacterium]